MFCFRDLKFTGNISFIVQKSTKLWGVKKIFRNRKKNVTKNTIFLALFFQNYKNFKLKILDIYNPFVVKNLRRLINKESLNILQK